jgi:hypothetical protein
MSEYRLVESVATEGQRACVAKTNARGKTFLRPSTDLRAGQRIYVVTDAAGGTAFRQKSHAEQWLTALNVTPEQRAAERQAVIDADVAQYHAMHKETDVTIGENAAAALDFAQPVCECGMLADECACTDEPEDTDNAPAIGNALADWAFAMIAPDLDDDEEGNIDLAPAWDAQLAAHAAAIVTGAALALTCLLPLRASAHELPPVSTDGECVITHEFEDGSATALCGHDTWAYDADGSFFYLDGIKFWIYPEGTWHEITSNAR